MGRRWEATEGAAPHSSAPAKEESPPAKYHGKEDSVWRRISILYQLTPLSPHISISQADVLVLQRTACELLSDHFADMSFTMEDTLESGWVAVRPNAFEEKEKHKFVFIVAWNEVEGKFAITCHNRTVQRRSFGRELPADASSLDGDKTKWPESPIRDKVSRSPGRGAREAVAKGCSPKAKSIKPSPVIVQPVMMAAAPPVSPDMEVLRSSREDQLSPSLDSLDLEDLDSLGREDCSWAGLFSFQDLRAIHQQLCSVNSDLEPCLPMFPEEPAGMWTVLFGPAEVSETEMDALCHSLQRYLGYALDTCGWKILSQVLFTENDDPDEYYESLSELRQSGYEEALNRATKHLQEVRGLWFTQTSP